MSQDKCLTLCWRDKCLTLCPRTNAWLYVSEQMPDSMFQDKCLTICLRTNDWLYVLGQMPDPMSQDMKTWLFHHDPMTSPTLYPFYLKSIAMFFQNRSHFHGRCNETKKFSVLKNIFYKKTALLGGLVQAKPLCHPVLESRGGSMSITAGRTNGWKSMWLILDVRERAL